MTWFDRLLGRRTSGVRVAPAAKPHDFCSHCGEPMVNGYQTVGEGFDRETGEPILWVHKRRICSTQHGKKPSKQGDAHDGGYIYSPLFEWREGPTAIRRPCPPSTSKKAVAK